MRQESSPLLEQSKNVDQRGSQATEEEQEDEENPNGSYKSLDG